jgi:integrase
LLSRAGLPAILIHDLRHTAATLLLSEGVNIKAVSETMGHSDIAITLGIYRHLLPTMQKDVTRAMERVLGARQVRA